ncbi:MAG: hypothetical protein ACK5O7_04425 [Holosporales bacterium]
MKKSYVFCGAVLLTASLASAREVPINPAGPGGEEVLFTHFLDQIKKKKFGTLCAKGAPEKMYESVRSLHGTSCYNPGIGALAVLTCSKSREGYPQTGEDGVEGFMKSKCNLTAMNVLRGKSAADVWKDSFSKAPEAFKAKVCQDLSHLPHEISDPIRPVCAQQVK